MSLERLIGPNELVSSFTLLCVQRQLIGSAMNEADDPNSVVHIDLGMRPPIVEPRLSRA